MRHITLNRENAKVIVVVVLYFTALALTLIGMFIGMFSPGTTDILLFFGLATIVVSVGVLLMEEIRVVGIFTMMIGAFLLWIYFFV